MNYNKKKKIKQMLILSHEIEYYSRVYKHCKKLDLLFEKLEKIKRT